MSTATRSVFVERGPVSLGCGTLILIVLIVLIFSSRGEDRSYELRNEIQKLESRIGALQKSIDDQSVDISRLEQQIRRLSNNNNAPVQPEKPAKE